ncbi:MAG: hypothetical protein H6741_13230 [Alphaproteobacteria bacterium]|nr:hypothetical protein [Alphaproteobacteria bacterium]
MVTASYRLETVSAGIVERLEGARRSYAGRPEAFEALAERVCAEALERVQADYEELFGDDGHVGELRRELAETFLPRYLRLAAQQTALEERARGLWAGGLLARAGAFAAAMLAALVVSRLIRNPFVIAFYISAFLVPFLPELRRWWEGRSYLAELQAMIDDLARVQDQLAEHRPRLLPPPHDGA